MVRKEPSRARTLLRQQVGDSISVAAAKDGMPVLEYGKTDGKNDPDGGAPSPHPMRTFLSHIGYRSSAHETAIAIATGTKSPASAVHIPAFEFDRRSSPSLTYSAHPTSQRAPNHLSDAASQCLCLSIARSPERIRTTSGRFFDRLGPGI